MKKRFSKGFTLVELLVVISIISLLSSIVLASLTAAKSKSRDALRVSQINQVRSALALYYSNHGQYPPNFSLNPGLTSDIARNWAAMMNALTTESLIRGGTFSKTDTKNPKYFSFINTAYATMSAVYYTCSIQDPFYKGASDYVYSYGYVASPDLQSYKIRIYLEDANSSLFNSSLAGSFLDVNHVTGNTACDKGSNYYCTGSAS